MYDLRSLKTTHSGGKETTIPIVTYSGHVNTCSFGLGFDVDPAKTVVAAAGDDNYVRLWSVNSGQRIQARLSENPFDDNVIGLQFSREMDGLWVGGQKVERWGI